MRESEARALVDARLRAPAALGMSFSIADAEAPGAPLVWVNDEFTRLTGYPAAEVLGRSCRFLQGPGTEPGAVARMGRAVHERRSIREVLLNYRRDGSPFWNEVAISPVADDTGRVTHLVGVQVDVSDRVAAERERAAQLEDERAGRRRADEARQRLELLGEVAQLLGRTGDVAEVLRRLTELVVPALADWALVDLVEEEGGREVHRVVGSAADPAQRHELRRVEALVPDQLDEGAISQRVLRSGRSSLVERLPEGFFGEVTRHPALRSALERLGGSSVVVVPLRGRSGSLGTLSLVRGEDRPPYAGADVALAEEVASRVAMIVENARLHARQRVMASALQRALLPTLPALPGLEVASGYLPGADGAQVGGDWYDAIATPDGGAVLVVGDVSGHDVVAAAAMGQYRSVLRAYVWEGHRPGAAVARLDKVVAAMGTTQVASLVCARLSPERPDGGRDLEYAVAGHPPPLLRRAGGGVERLEGGRSPVVGLDLDEDPRRTASARLDRGDVLLLYTDGLVEQPGSDLADLVDDLARTLSQVGGRSAQEVCARLLGTQADRPAVDDLTVLALRVTGGAGSSHEAVRRGLEELRVVLPADPSAARLARAAVRRFLRDRSAAVDEDTAVLLVSEVVSNAIEAGARAVELTASRRGSDVLLEVEDDAVGSVSGRSREMPPGGATSGRGLALVDALSARWGVEVGGRGKTLWFVLGGSGSGSASASPWTGLGRRGMGTPRA